MANGRICCVIHSLDIGGMERVMAILLRYFDQNRMLEVHLILIGINRKISYPLTKNIIIHKPGFKFDNRKRFRHTLRTIYFLRKQVLDIAPDSLLSFGEYWNNFVLLALTGLKIPIFISDRSQPNKDLGKLHNILRRNLYPRAKGYIAQTEKSAKLAKINRWNKNIEVIGNPIRGIESNTDVERKNIVLMVGRLIPTKHVDELIHVFSQINPEGWKLVIVGGNAKKMNLLEEYRKLVKELEMNDKIELVGEVANVDQYLSQSKIFAFMSSSEGFPNALGEAMNAGLACVSYDCIAGPSDMITDGKNGFLVPVRDKILFRTKLELLMSRTDIRLDYGKKAKQSMKEYKVDRIADKFYKFISDNS